MSPSRERIVVIIPTIDRSSLIRSIESVESQTRKPDLIIVVNNGAAIDIRDRAVLLKNTRTDNLSGKINTGLKYLLKNGFNPNTTSVALLDDDDYWESDYLSNCERKMQEGVYDWIISGIIRHDTENPEGRELEIPDALCFRDFLTTNPNIQGSSIFVKLSQLLRAGCFDEMMVSTTDRDICIRLLMLPDIKYGFVNKHFIHHCAMDKNRLSTPGNEMKKKGLEYFLYKYGPMMTDYEVSAFLKRSKEKFDIDLEVLKSDDVKTKNENLEETSVVFDIRIGIIAIRFNSVMNLIKDIRGLVEKGLNVKKVHIIYNSFDVIEETDNDFVEWTHVDNIDANNICEQTLDVNGILGPRQMLHFILHRESSDDEVIWILDDDVRMSYLEDSRQLKGLDPQHIYQRIELCQRKGFDIGVGMITGDPPIPPISKIRTELLDIFYNSHRNNVVNYKQSTHLPDYYYDYSEKHTNHLEMPTWMNNSNRSLKDMIEGRYVTRPVIYDSDNSQYRGIIARGGNTFVLNRKCLLEPYNVSLRVNGGVARRADTVWSLICEKRLGYRVGNSELAVYQFREDGATCISNIQLFYDFVGRAITRSLANYFTEEGYDPLQVFQSKMEDYMADYLMNSYRVNAIIDMLNVCESLDESEKEILKRPQTHFSEIAYHEMTVLRDCIETRDVERYFDFVLGNGNKGS